MNKIELIGRMTSDPALKQDKNGKDYLNFAIAVDDGFGDKKKTHFFNCVSFGSTAAFLARNLRKGFRVGIEGKLANNNYENKETGKTVYNTEIVVTEVTLIDFVQKDSGQPSSQTSQAQAAAPAQERVQAQMENLQQQAEFLADEDLPL